MQDEEDQGITRVEAPLRLLAALAPLFLKCELGDGHADFFRFALFDSQLGQVES